ncbi:HDOD domain-containing protein [Ectothiorhodospiraceae bacterium WFHF3C12]|nr:HDOD domain-containing protein [Ectothiorhodospiraceae bacterium WFHF3C12]
MDEPQDLCIARQPICDADGRIVGYELLYRAYSQAVAAVQDRDLATTEVVVTGFLDLGLDTLVRAHPAHINLSPAFLEGQLELPAITDRIVLELPGDAAATEARIEGATRLAEQGFRLVLDDFEYGLELEPLLEIASGVKLDMTALEPARLQEYAALAHASGLPVIAKGVEDHGLLREARALRCSAFQGYYFTAPELIRGRSLPGNHAVLLNLLNRLQDPDLEVDELDRLVVQDATLAYRLLRYANSAALSLSRRVETVRDAVLLLGARLVRQWTTLLVLARFGDAHPEPLLDSALLRARMCQILTTEQHIASADAGFTAGLFSTLDALLGVPIDELVDQISLERSVREALVSGNGELGRLLRRTVAYEAGRWASLPVEDLTGLKPAYDAAVRWCDETRALLADVHPGSAD